MQEKTNTENQTTSRLRDYLLRIVRPFNFKFWALLFLVIGLLVAFIRIMNEVVGSISDEAWRFVNSVEDPTERGCLYIAFSILTLSFIVAMKTFSTEKVKVIKD